MNFKKKRFGSICDYKSLKVIIVNSYNGWSQSDSIYSAISAISHFNIRHKSLIVVVFKGLFFRSLSIIALDI